MKLELKKLYVVFISILGLCAGVASAYAAAANPALLKAKKEAEAKGYIFAASQEEVIANAKKEGKLRVMGSLDAKTLKALSEAFRKKYPFIDSQAQEIAGTDNYIRMIQEMKAGMAKGWDVNYVPSICIPNTCRFRRNSIFWGWRNMASCRSPRR